MYTLMKNVKQGEKLKLGVILILISSKKCRHNSK